MTSSSLESFEWFCDPGCPVECLDAIDEVEQREIYDIRSRAVEDLFMGKSTFIDRSLSQTAEALNQIFGEGSLSQADIDDTAKTMRQAAAAGLESTANEIGEIVVKRQKFAAACSKPCTLTKTIDGQQFVVTVCTSPLAYTDPSNTHVPAHVEHAFEL